MGRVARKLADSLWISASAHGLLRVSFA